MDCERVNVEIVNALDILGLHVQRLEAMSQCDDPALKRRLAKTASIMSSRTGDLATKARRVCQSYPNLT